MKSEYSSLGKQLVMKCDLRDLSQFDQIQLLKGLMDITGLTDTLLWDDDCVQAVRHIDRLIASV